MNVLWLESQEFVTGSQVPSVDGSYKIMKIFKVKKSKKR